MTNMTVRQFRAAISQAANSSEPTLLQNRNRTIALFVPIHCRWRYDSSEYAKALVIAQGLANQAFRELRKGFE